MLKLLDTASFYQDPLEQQVQIISDDSAGFEKKAAHEDIQKFISGLEKKSGYTYLHINAMTAGEFPPDHRSGRDPLVLTDPRGSNMDARREGWSRAPVVEMLIPSTLDDTLAPQGRHVASLFVQYVAPHLPAPRSWSDTAEKEAFADIVLDTVTRHAPNFRGSVIARQVLSPLDLEQRFGLIDGDIFHGQLGLGQLFSARPVLGHADYRLGLQGLYLCGSGAHPGGGVTGLPGMNAAREIAKDLRLKRR